MNQLEIDDALMEGMTDGKQMYQEVMDEMRKPALDAQRAAMWYAILAKMLPGMPPQMAEKRLMEIDKARYEAAKKRFMEAKDGPK